MIKNILFLSTIFLVSSGIYAQEKLSGTEVKRTYYPNGILKTQGQFKFGRLNGIYLEYYPDGKFWKKWTFEDGKENGQSVWFFPDGKISIEWNYHNGSREGISKWYYETGRNGRHRITGMGNWKELLILIIKPVNFRENGIL